MGIYLNPGKDKFQSIRKKKYIDKSALISCVNANLDTRLMMPLNAPYGSPTRKSVRNLHCLFPRAVIWIVFWCLPFSIFFK